jgi:uncharacterized protein YndB with AHSA1/START domain
MKKEIRHQFFYPHPPEKVWHALTDPDLIGQWLMKNNFQPVVGHKFEFLDRPKPGFKWDGTAYCEVLEVMPYKKLSYSWKGGPKKGETTLDSVVTWTLTPKDQGTELLLEHTGFDGVMNYISGLIMDKGWKHKILKRLEKVLNAETHAAV